ncbi:MAG: hypothetical protein RL199_995 [Pseudomonadota bacterium]
MRLDIHDDAGSFAALAQPWDALHLRAGLLGPFNRFGWQFDWWSALGQGRSLRLVVARKAGAVVGLMPLFEEPGPVRTLALVGSRGGGGDFLDVIASDDDVRRGLLAHAVAALRPDALRLDDLLETSPTVPIAFAISKGRAVVSARYPCPYLDLRSPGPARPRAETLGRRERWLTALPGHRVDVETSASACASFLERFRRLHEARWEADGGSQAFADGRLWHLHRRSMERFADEGRLRLWTLSVAGEAVAVAWTFDDGRRSLYYQCGFSPAWSARSVGGVLLARYLEDARQRGVEEVDFLRGAEAYKREWTRTARRTVRVFWPLTAKAAVAETAGRLLDAGRRHARRVLPPAVAVPLTRAWRAARTHRGQHHSEERT